MKTRGILALVIALAMHGQIFAHDSFMGKCVDSGLDVIYSYSHNGCVMGLSDGSHWKLKQMEKRPGGGFFSWFQTKPIEAELEDAYFFNLKEWNGLALISVHEADRCLSSREKHILLNEKTGQKVFAEFIPRGSEMIPKMEYVKKVMENATKGSDLVAAPVECLGEQVLMQGGSVWQLHPVQQNTRSVSQWWNGEMIDQPDEVFVTSIKDWRPGDSVRVYISDPQEENLSHKYRIGESANKVTILHNRTRCKIAYASFVPPMDFADQVKKYGANQKESGRIEGYIAGMASEKARNARRDQKNYNQGYQAALKECARVNGSRDNAYERGYTNGYAAGLIEMGRGSD